jgi:hypothetical protein
MQAYNTIFTNNTDERLLFNLKIGTSTKYHSCTGFVWMTISFTHLGWEHNPENRTDEWLGYTPL